MRNRTLRNGTIAALSLLSVGVAVANDGWLHAQPTPTPIGATAAGSSTPATNAGGGHKTGDKANTSRTTPTSEPTPAASDGTYKGDAVNTPYGPIEVDIAVSAGRVTGVQVPTYPSDPHSQQINGYALPTLVQETLAAQSSSVDAVSGATYTSAGYQQSLQSALDQAGL